MDFMDRSMNREEASFYLSPVNIPKRTKSPDTLKSTKRNLLQNNEMAEAEGDQFDLDRYDLKRKNEIGSELQNDYEADAPKFEETTDHRDHQRRFRSINEINHIQSQNKIYIEPKRRSYSNSNDEGVLECIKLDYRNRLKFSLSANLKDKANSSFLLKPTRTHLVDSSPFSKDMIVGNKVNLTFEDQTNMKEIYEQKIDGFMDKKVTFEGKNIKRSVKKLISFCRAIVEQPKIIITFEESFDFGMGIENNLQTISKKLPDSTILCITKETTNLLSFDKILFIDSGKIIEKGDPRKLISDKRSYLYTYLKEVESQNLKYLKNKLENFDDTQHKINFDSSQNDDSYLSQIGSNSRDIADEKSILSEIKEKKMKNNL